MARRVQAIHIDVQGSMHESTPKRARELNGNGRLPDAWLTRK
jgi:hypothetical protein